MTSEDYIINMLVGFAITATAILVIDAAVEDDGTLVAIAQLELELAETD